MDDLKIATTSSLSTFYLPIASIVYSVTILSGQVSPQPSTSILLIYQIVFPSTQACCVVFSVSADESFNIGSHCIGHPFCFQYWNSWLNKYTLDSLIRLQKVIIMQNILIHPAKQRPHHHWHLPHCWPLHQKDTLDAVFLSEEMPILDWIDALK